MKKIIGYLNKGLGKTLDLLLIFFIFIIEFIVTLIDNVKKLLSIFSLLFIFFIFNPFLFSIILLNPEILVILIVLFVVPLLGKGLVSYLKYLHYTVTEYFYDKADFYLLGKDNRKGSFNSYSQEYIRQKEEERRRESERRAREQQRIWEEMFRDFYNQSQNQNQRYGGYSYGNYGRGGPYSGSSSSQGGFYNPTNDFIKKYEESCRVLEIEPTTDKYEIKLAYRKMAKKYHPDINKSPDSTVKFQKINEANEFLSEANINRYQQLKK